jgi:Flp pilus assembly protein TadG
MGLLERFKKDQSGATAMLFGLTLIPLMGFAGAALDYGRATSGRTHLQRAVDGTALALAREAGALNDAQLKQRGEDLVKAYLKAAPGIANQSITVKRDAKTIRVAATGSIKTAVMGVLGFNAIAIGSDAAVAWGSKKIELALVLDNTGSMGWTAKGVRKIEALKKASNDLLNILYNATSETDTIKVSVVPFNTQVRVDTAQTGKTPYWLAYSGSVNPSNWQGYVEDRNQPHDVDNKAPKISDPDTLHPAAARAYAPDLAPIKSLTPIRLGLSGLKTAVDAMQPSGNTNITIGVSWGLATLTNAEPMSGAVPTGTKDVEKVMIVLTDGDNTQNRINGVKNYSASKIDPRTREACEVAKAADITVITIRVVEGNAGLLKKCASKPTDPKHPFYRNGSELYHDVQNPADLTPLFQNIANQILATRLTH